MTYKQLWFNGWMSYMIVQPVFSLLVGDPLQGSTGLIYLLIN